MRDKLGRDVNYLKLSITDSCNLNCIYCISNHTHKEELLSNEQILKIITVFSKLGINKIKIAGKEPLLRNDLVELLKGINSIQSINDISITTNGILLYSKIEELHKYGVNEVNITLNTLDFKKYAKITSGGNLESVLYSINKALINNIKVKLNILLIKGINDDEILDFIKITEDNELDVCFIELASKGKQLNYEGVNNKNIIKFIKRHFNIPVLLKRDSNFGSTKYLQIPGWRGRIGFISSVSIASCSEYNRISLDPYGNLNQYTYKKNICNLKYLLEDGIDDSSLETIIHDFLYSKPKKIQLKRQSLLNY